ncbi:phage tail tape measure protein, TP901 family [Halorubrum coriense DSM 10284]|uniref:Phage tail tape measure protein, TP901 family n=1 Tax=Halorubrum coriense DSM 10284 TaxID=1227466 RepID=M0EPI4_9EURY|nr:phage tail tape measure protein [Halorubrum coriense]ELZ48978.1 phage tail tape measure protein, TP901 family [Halorubrum coriense DSM 10284]QRG24129.1 tape measure protein [Halorubrum virus Humcor1]
MAVADTLRGIITADASGVEKAVSDADQQLGSLSDRAQATGEKMQSAGRTMTMGISAPLAAMGGVAVRQAASFDKAMAESMSVMGDVSDTMEEDLRQTAREVATATEHSHEQSARALYFLSSAGLDAAESMEALPEAADFATAGQMSLEQATSVLTTTMKAYGREASETGEITDTLAKTVASSNTTMQQMSTAMSQVGPVAASLGMDLDETAAAIGAISNAGVQGERAGTALRNVMSQLSDETSTASKQLEQMGVTTRNAQGEIVSMSQLLQNMEEAGVEAGEAAKIFGMEAAPAMAALMEQGGGSLEEFTKQIENAEGATKSMAGTQRDTLNVELQKTKSQLNDAAVTIGADLMPMVSTLAGYIGTLANRFSGLSQRQQKAVIAAGALGVALGPVIWALGTLVTSASALSSAYATLAGVSLTSLVPSLGAVSTAGIATQVALGPVTVPIWAIIAAIGALVGAAAGLWYAWNNNVLGIKDTTQAAFQQVKRWFTSAPSWMLALLGPVGQLYLAWREDLFGVQSVVDSVFGFIGDKISWLRDQIANIPGIGENDIAPEAEDVIPEPEKVGKSGAEAGSNWKEEFEANATPSVTPGSSGPIKGEMTPEIRSALKEGVDGYVSDPDKIEDVPTEINKELFDAVASNGGATADSLGVSEREFKILMQRFAGGGGWSTPSADLVDGASGSPSPSVGSAGMTPEEFKTALREVLDGLRLDARLDTDQRGFEQFIEDIVDTKIADAGKQSR